MSLPRALAGGFLGACALTALHEAARRALPHAPRMDVLGMRALARLVRGAGADPPRGEALRGSALLGDLAVNTAYYGLVGLCDPEEAVGNGALLGLAAGVGALTLPGPLGLGTDPALRTSRTAAMTVGLYLAGGLAAGLAYRSLSRRRARPG